MVLRLVVLIVLLVSSAWANPQDYPAHHFKVEFPSSGWVVESDETQMITFGFGDPWQMRFMVQVKRRLGSWDTMTDQERLQTSRKMLEGSPKFSFDSAKLLTVQGWPAVLCEATHKEDGDLGYFAIVNSDQRSFLLIGLGKPVALERFKREFSAILKSFTPTT